VTDKAKTTMLARVRAGIDVYRAMLNDDPKLLERLPVDLSLDDECCRAERRLQEGVAPIVQLPAAVPQLSLRRSGSGAVGLTPRQSTARGASTVASDAGPSASTAARPPATTPRPATASARAALVSKPGKMKINAAARLHTQPRSATASPASASPGAAAPVAA